MVSLSYEMKALLENDDVEFLGELLDTNWQLKRQLAAGISDPQIDEWYKKGITAGATGGKILGAGNGGFIMYFAPKEKHIDIEGALSDLQKIPFGFDTEGSKILFSD